MSRFCPTMGHLMAKVGKKRWTCITCGRRDWLR